MQAVIFCNANGQFVPATVEYAQQPDGTYVPTYPRGRELFQQLPNGPFTPVR